MYDGIMLVAGEMCLQGEIEIRFQVGDRIMVLFGDTPILGTIYSAIGFDNGREVLWNVRTDLSDQTYPIHENFLRPVFG